MKPMNLLFLLVFTLLGQGLMAQDPNDNTPIEPNANITIIPPDRIMIPISPEPSPGNLNNLESNSAEESCNSGPLEPGEEPTIQVDTRPYF